MLSAELKRKLIDPKYGNWTSLTEVISKYNKRSDHIAQAEYQEYYDKQTADYERNQALEVMNSPDEVILWLNVLLPDNRVYEWGVMISYLETDESFVKELKEYVKTFSVDDCAEYISQRYSLNLKDRKYMAEYVYRVLTDTIRSLSEGQNISREGAHASMLSKEFLEAGIFPGQCDSITQRILPDGKEEAVLTLDLLNYMEEFGSEEIMEDSLKAHSCERHNDMGFSIVFDGTDEDFSKKFHFADRSLLKNFSNWLVNRYNFNMETANVCTASIREYFFDYWQTP